MSYMTFSEKMAGRLLVHFRKASEKSRIRMIRTQMFLFKEQIALRTSGEEKAKIMYLCLLNAIYMDFKIENKIHTKQPLGDEEGKQLFEKRIAEVGTRKRKPAPKEEMIKLRYMILIAELRKSGLSWRQVSLYLKKYHSFKVSYAYLKMIFKKNINLIKV